MTNKVYLVTGAAGFLGSNVCAQLLERGEKVRAFVLEGDKSAKYIPSEVDVFYGDLCNKASLEPFFTVEEGVETICIHVASMVTVNPYYRKLVLDVNVGGTENIVDLCLEHPECRKLVYVSSTGAIPELPHGQKIKEVEEVNLDELEGWYSKSKAMATNNVYTAMKKRGLKACVVYPTGIFGPNDHAISETTSTIIKIINGEMPVGINGSFNLVDVRDLAERIARRMEKKAAKTGEMPLMTTFSVYNLKRNNQFDYSKAERVLGYTTRPLEVTLRDQIQWLKENGKI